MTFRTSLAALCAGLLLLLGCAAAKGPSPEGIGSDRIGRIAVLPIANLSNSPAPLAEIHQALSDKLKGRGFDVMAQPELERLMEKIRMRDTGSLSSVNARAFKENAGVSAVLITDLELYDEKDPPKLALSARLVSTGENPKIEWAHSVALAGDDAPGLLGLGLIEDPKVLLENATTELAGSLASFASGRESGYDENSGKFKPKVDYVSSAAGVGLRVVSVDFAVRSSGRDETVSPARIPVSLSAPSPRKVTVKYAVTGGTAENGKDYTLKNGTLVFGPGELSKDIDIGIIDDKLYRGDRTIELTLSNPVNAVLGRQTVHTYTIIDNDPRPAVAFSSSAQEVRENAGSAAVTVQLSEKSGKDVAVPFTVSGTGQARANYTVTPSPLIIKAGATSGTITITLLDDKRYEDNKSIVVTLGAPEDVTVSGRSVHWVTVLESDPAPAVGFALKESSGDEGKTPAKIDVSLSSASGRRTSVEYAVAGGSAVNNRDYTLKNGILVFEPGETVKSIDIGINDNKLHENNKTIVVTLANPVNAVLGAQAVHTYTIIDNDPPPAVAFSASAQEVRKDGGSATMTVKLSGESGKDVTVPFTVNGTAADGKNYRIMTPSPLIIKAGTTAAGITMALLDNNRYEENKTIVVTLGTPVNATSGEYQAHTVTVTETNPPPAVSFMLKESSGEESITSARLGVCWVRQAANQQPSPMPPPAARPQTARTIR